jgi:hypothetical protein
MLYGGADPLIASHGSISLTVNFYALQKYFSLSGGWMQITPHQAAPIDIAIGCLGLNQDALQNLCRTFRCGFCTLHPYDLFVLRDHIEDTSRNSLSSSNYSLPLSVICLLLEIGAYDIDIFLQFENYFHSVGATNEIYRVLRLLQNHESDIRLSCLEETQDLEARTKLEELIRRIQILTTNDSQTNERSDIFEFKLTIVNSELHSSSK